MAQTEQSDVSFADLCSTPGIYGHIHSHLSTSDKSALRCTCRSLRSQVNQYVHTLQLQAPELPPDILDAWNKHLATSELRPQALLLSDNPGNFSLLSASEVWQDVQTVVLGTLTGQLTEALASNIPNLRVLQVRSRALPDADWHSLLSHFSHLHTLDLSSDDLDVPPAFYEALQSLPSLRTLRAMGHVNYPALAALTQLQDLTLPLQVSSHLQPEGAGTREELGPAALGRLTGLTTLRLTSHYDLTPPALWQQHLSSALTALSKLQHLLLPRVWPGPIAAALGQMPSVTQLSITLSQPSVNDGLHLPGVQLLRLAAVDLGFLATLSAPQLQSIQGNVWHLESGSSGVSRVIVTLGTEGPSAKQQAALLEQCAQGVLGRCNRLMLRGAKKCPESLVMSALQVLGKWWRPEPGLVDGSSPHVHIPAPAEVMIRPRAEGVAVADGWFLILSALPLSRKAMAALPQGVTRLELWSCELHSDSLDALSALPSLRRLILGGSPYISSKAVQRLLSSAPQGCLLRIELADCMGPEKERKCEEARAALVAQKGSRNVPALQVS